jgi:hypothetical protein
MRAPVARLTLHGEPSELRLLAEVEADLKAAGVVDTVRYVTGDSFAVEVELDGAVSQPRPSGSRAWRGEVLALVDL